MSKINFLAVILIATLLGSCGFHAPNKGDSLNVSIDAQSDNKFANTLKKRLNPHAAQFLHIQIGDEIFKQQNASYKPNNEVNGYNLSLSVPIQVFDRKKKRLFIGTLSAKSYVNRIIETQANRLQINQNKTQLRQKLVKKILRKLNRL